MKITLAYVMLTLGMTATVGAVVGLIDSEAAQRGRVVVEQPATPTERSETDWPACEDASPGEACQMFDDFDGDGTNTIGYFPKGM